MMKKGLILALLLVLGLTACSPPAPTSVAPTNTETTAVEPTAVTSQVTDARDTVIQVFRNPS